MTTDLPRLVYESRLKYDWEKDIAIWHDTHKVTLIDHLGGFNEEFKNSMLETIFNDVLEYIKTTSLQGIQPEAAVDELPPAEGANAQPGAEQSALPTTPPTA